MLMNSHESRTPGVLFTGAWRHKPSHGAVGALLCAAAFIMLGRTMLLFFQEENISIEKIQQAAALGVAGFVLFYFGTTLLFSVVTGYAKRLVISEDGVRYGGRFYGWGRLRWIDGRLSHGGHQIHIGLRSGLFREKQLKIDDGLSQEQWERLLGQLKERVLPNHPHLRAGDDAHSVKPVSEAPQEAAGAIQST